MRDSGQSENTIEKLLAAKVIDINNTNNNRQTPIYIAALKGN